MAELINKNKLLEDIYNDNPQDIMKYIGEYHNSMDALTRALHRKEMKMKSYKNIEYEDVIICPYCGEKYKPTYEETYIGDKCVDCFTESSNDIYVCDCCHKKFSLDVDFIIKYFTSTIDGEMTEEEQQNQVWKK